MKKLIRIILLLVVFFGFSYVLNIDNRVNAFPYSTIAECKTAMGSYYNIEDVSGFYCPIGVEDNDYYGGGSQICTAWLGNGTETTITVTSLTGKTSTVYSGFCSYGSNQATVNTTDDNDSIQDDLTLNRLAWPSIGKSAAASIDIQKFVTGVNPVSCGAYNCYSRYVNVGRVRSGVSVIPAHEIMQKFTIRILKSYKLTFDIGNYTSISVSRESSPNGGGNIGTLSNGATIYEGDTLKVTMSSTNSCADLTTHTVAGTTRNSGYVHTVSGNTTVKTRSTWRSYTLTTSAGTGTTISSTVNGTSQSSGSISCGSKVSATFGLKAGYSWGTHSFVGSGISNTTSLSISNHVVGADVTIKASADRDAYSAQASVAQGENWNGTSNNALTGFVSAGASKTITVPCANTGCKANFWLELRRDVGLNQTTYWTASTRSGGNPSSWSLPTTSTFTADKKTLLILGTSSSVGKIESFKPGQGKCHHLRFRPYGSYGNDDWKQVYACANAEVSYFEGRSSVSGYASGSTDWTGSTKSSNYFANNCSGGCPVTLTHELKRTQGIGSTDYKVIRTSNLIFSTRSIANNDNVKSGTFGSSLGTVQTSSHTIYPGMVLCEKMTFKPHNNVESPASDVSTTICASALGDAQPSDPSDPDKKENPNVNFGDDSFVNIKVRNQNVALYNDYQRTVYAKPGDKVFFRSSYNPVLQYTYFLTPQQMRIDSGTVYSGGGNSLGALYNANKGARNPDLKDWNNGFAVQKTYDADFSSNDASTLQSLTYDPGDSSKQRSPDYPHSVGVGDVGRSIDARAITNLNATVQTTPGQVTFTNNGGNNLGNVITDARFKIAYAKVPYNYDTDLKITTTPEDKTLYAGEGDQKVNMEIVIKPKENKQTMNSGDSNYSTKIGNPRYKVIVYRPEENTPTTGTSSFGGEDICYGYFGIQNNEVNCGYSVEVNGESASRNVNENPKYHEDNVKPIESPAFNVQDLEAGQKICIAAAFWPSSSGADTSMDADGSHTWRISDSVCFTIAKKPTMQIWGGTISTAGSIGGAITTKNNFAGRTYSVGNSNGTSYTFGSWDEIGVFSAGVVNSFGSGASMGFSKMNGRDFTHDLGGYAARSTSHPPCEKLNTLTIAADKNGDDEDSNKTAITCTKDIDTNQTNGYSDISSQVTQEKSALIGMFMVPVKDAEGNEKLASGDVTLDDDSDDGDRWINSVGVYYYHGKDSLTVPQQSVLKGTTHVIHSEANISIAGNLIYDQASGYQKLSDVSKLVIYAQGNIYINCNVNRVDAMLIADGTVVTCGDSTTDLSDNAIRSNINNPANSNPLVINGTIVAGRLIANRTYGMATGTSSVIPAEIINYDPTLYLWGADKMDVTSTGKVHITYSKELPPRY